MKTQYINLSVNKNNFVRYKNIKSLCLYGNEKELGNFLISICIPTFKRTNLLKEALDSALNQKTDVPYCILILDNENTGIENENYKLVKKYNSPQIFYYQNYENIGMAGNWNRCAELIQTKYFVYLHDDDLLKNMFIQTVFDIISKNNKISCLITAIEHLNYPGCKNEISEKKGLKKIKSIFFEKLRPKYIKMRTLVPNLFLDNMYGPPTCGMLFKRCDFLNSGGFDSDYYPVLDWFFLIFFSQKYSILKYRKKISLYRWQENESLKPETKKAFKQSHKIVRAYLNKKSIFCRILIKIFQKDFIKKEYNKQKSFLFSFFDKIYRYIYSN